MSELIIDIATRKEYTIDVKRSGENAQPCPKCSQDRKNKSAKSFSYNAMTEVGYCQNCNSKFAKKKEFIPVQQKKEYVRPQWQNITQLPDKLVQWFKGRGISQQTLIETKVTFAEEWMPQINGKAKVMCFNYFREGELINTKYRDNAKNFKLVKDAELIFYNLDAIKGQKEVIICEGEADCLSYVEVGIKNVVSVPNGAAKGSLKLDYLDNCWEWFEKVDKIYLATDDDEAGRILQEELARRLGKEKCFRVSFYGCKDANELLQKDPLKLPQTIKDAAEYPIEGVYTAKSIESEIWDLKRNGLKPACGIGIESFDKMITFEGGYVTLVTGIVGHGKSEFTDQMIVGLNLIHGWKAAYYSPENWPIKLHHSKLATKLTGGDFNTESDNITADAINYCSDNFYMICPELDFSLQSILDTATQLVKKHGVKALVIDAWNKLDHLYTGNESQYISKELDKLDTFAKRTGVHVFLIAHPTKMKKEDDGLNYAIPDGYSISGSAAFFSKPANVICVYRRYFTDGSSQPEIFCQKCKFKHWGTGRGSAPLMYNYTNGRYTQHRLDYTNYLERKQETLDFSEPQEPAMKPNQSFITPIQTELIYDGESTEFSNGSDDCPF